MLLLYIICFILLQKNNLYIYIYIYIYSYHNFFSSFYSLNLLRERKDRYQVCIVFHDHCRVIESGSPRRGTTNGEFLSIDCPIFISSQLGMVHAHRRIIRTTHRSCASARVPQIHVVESHATWEYRSYSRSGTSVNINGPAWCM